MRPDPLFNELANGVKNADEASVRDTYLQVFFCIWFIFKTKFENCVRNSILVKILRNR